MRQTLRRIELLRLHLGERAHFPADRGNLVPMARASILTTRTMDFGELIGNGKVYRVPPYQRDYSWSEEQWDDLWADIRELGPNDSHYMGALVLESRSDRDYLIIDGQQRVATLSVLALAIIARLHTLASDGNQPEHNLARAAELRRSFIGEKDPASLVESSKVFLNETDNPFYQDYLVQLRSHQNPRRLARSNRQLDSCFAYFRNRILELSISNDGEKLARLLNESISRQLLFIVIYVENEINAYTVFETLNARGIELTTTDLLKNYLFSRIRVQSDFEVIQRRWRTLIATVRAEHFPEFLRYHLQTTEPRVRSKRVFKLVRDATPDGPSVFRLLDDLEQRAELFSALSDPAHAYWIERPEAKPYIRELVLFRVKQMTPLIFAAYEKLERNQFESVLRTVSVLLFRYTVVSDLNTNPLEPVFHQAAKALLDGTAKNPRDVAEILSKVYVDDRKFEQDMRVMSIVTAGQRKHLAKYVLSRIESSLTGREVDFETDPGSIEHILPENAGVEWEEAFPTSTQDANVYRLGNLTLLEPAANRSLGNGAYPEKVTAYRASSYRITQDIADEAPMEWNAALIDQRQSRIAREAVRTWRIDF